MTSTYRISVPLKNIHPNPNNPRKEAGDVTELAASIKAVGLKDKLQVRPAPEIGPDQFMLEDGFRRWTAMRHIPGITDTEVDVSTPEPDEDLAVRALVTALTTTIHKQDLRPMERAKAYGRLRDEAGMTQRQIADLMGLKSDSTVSNALALLELTPRSQQAVASGRVTVDRAVKAVKDYRAKARKEKGHKPIDPGWEPDHFTSAHPLAKKAKLMCDAREHTGRRRYGGVACGNCFETVIRQDENKVVRLEYKDAGFDVPFLPPIMTPSNPNGNNKHAASGREG